MMNLGVLGNFIYILENALKAVLIVMVINLKIALYLINQLNIIRVLCRMIGEKHGRIGIFSIPKNKINLKLNAKIIKFLEAKEL